MKLRIILLLVAITGLLYADTTEFQRLLAEGETYYRKGIAGDERAVDMAIERLESALKREPGHPLAMVFLGSCYTLVARDKRIPWVKLRWAKRGLELIDRAVEQNPANVRIRLERFMNNLNLPSVLKRGDYIRDDLEFLIPRIDKTPLPVDQRQSFYLEAGDYLYREEQEDRAADCWQRCVSIDPASQAGRQAEKRLRADS
jgi:tetratricopeptide (TPR) repeat protein